MKFSKKILAAFLAALMAISMMPFTVFAAPPGSSEIGTGTGGISIGGGTTAIGEEPYLTFTGTDSFSIKTNNDRTNWNGTLQYSTDANTWTTWNGTQISSDNNVLYLRGTGNTIITGSNSSKYWVITTQGTVACSGDIRTLLDYDEPDSSSMGNYCFSNLFYNCTSLTAAPELPATILAEHCYSYMFDGCTSLTMAPELPATMLAYACYYNMFNGCTSLTTAPELPSTSLAQFCYANMFNGCTSLTTAPELPATSLAPSCYNSMFQGCTSLTTAPELWATTLTYACYYNMFNGCANLTTAPELPANDLAGRCYYNMFRDCTSLTTPSELWATDLTEGCYYGMFQGCTGIKLSTEQTAEYSAPYSIPKEETAESVGYDALTNMFTGTGGTFTGTPTINTTYYIPGSAPVYTDGFMVGDDHYDTLDEAIAGSASGDTITALSDVDFTIYPAFTRHTFDLSGRTLDLDGHTITGYNHSVVYVGDNFTIKNGNMVCVYDSVNNKKESYAAVIYPQVGNWQTDVVTDKSTGVVLENLVLTGGINCFGADVTVRGENTNVTGNYYYALWADVLATLTVEDGTFTSAASSTNGIIGACSDAGKEAYVYISGGDYTVPAGKNLVLQSTMASSQQLVEISGGTYNVVVPAKACAEGFVPVTEPDAQGKYTVAVVQYGTIEQMTGATITGNGTAHEKITISNVNLNYADPDYSVGRYYAGYYLSGVKFIAPEGTVISENARYTNGSIDSTTGQLKVKNLYTAKDGANYMYSWPHVTEESLKEAIAAGVNKTWEYTFDWDGDGIFEQEAIIEIVCDTVTLVKDGQQIYPVPANNGANLALEGIIEENIYIDADAYNLGDDAVIKVTYNASTNISETAQEVTDVYNVKDLTPFDDPKDEFDGTYKFAFKQAPAQITEDVVVALYADENAQEPVKTITYSTKDYCDNVIATSNNAKLVALCKSILDYGMAAQLEFEYNLENPAETDGFYNAAAIEALTYSDITGTRLEDGIGITGCAFQCLANTNINLYIDYPLTGAGIINAYVDDGNDQTPVSATYMHSTKTGRLFISVNGIAADDMTKDFTVVTSNNGSVTTNLNTIVKTCLYYGTATTLAKTIYFYADAANTYFN